MYNNYTAGKTVVLDFEQKLSTSRRFSPQFSTPHMLAFPRLIKGYFCFQLWNQSSMVEYRTQGPIAILEVNNPPVNALR